MEQSQLLVGYDQIFANHTKQNYICVHFTNSLLANLSRSYIYENVQNERAAIMVHDVRRGLGMLPQRAIFVKAPKGDFAKMSKPVQVCTACQFVKGENIE